ncbi:protein ARV1 [Scaptodrosophila lebanonensis]|uniref:Protein ARV n=1 Tax=Drosophila lebanonensis TaxID=7225 RepID=A0A6J2U4B6_DROLE|nr:protein ARV1 [Scaptodrosophila lebanonensis]
MIEKPKYVCINCGHGVRDLHKNYSNTVKTTHCEQCKKVADKYIEFEELIILLDALLLSQQAFRHMIYNDSFKLYWKISLVLLLLESFALCRQRRDDESGSPVNEKSFYMCVLQNIGDYVFITLLLLLVTTLRGGIKFPKAGLGSFTITLLKAVVISNLSKFFLLPILVWRNNTTDLGSQLHYMLVTSHNLCSLILAYEVVGASVSRKRWLTSLFVIGVFLLKEYLKLVAARHSQNILA